MYVILTVIIFCVLKVWEAFGRKSTEFLKMAFNQILFYGEPEADQKGYLDQGMS